MTRASTIFDVELGPGPISRLGRLLGLREGRNRGSISSSPDDALGNSSSSAWPVGTSDPRLMLPTAVSLGGIGSCVFAKGKNIEAHTET